MSIQSLIQAIVGRARHSVRAAEGNVTNERRARSDAPYRLRNPFVIRHSSFVISGALLLTLAGLFFARTAFAKILVNTIDPVGIVADQGRHVTVSGPIAVTAGERTELRVTVTQRATGAVADGVVFFTGTGQTNQWEVTATAQTPESFVAGPATAVAVGRTTLNGKATDAHQWLVNITLVKE